MVTIRLQGTKGSKSDRRGKPSPLKGKKKNPKPKGGGKKKNIGRKEGRRKKTTSAKNQGGVNKSGCRKRFLKGNWQGKNPNVKGGEAKKKRGPIPVSAVGGKE